MMGNRGILHNDIRQIIRYSQVRRWITCRVEVPGRRRQVMRPHSYTELFFLDEATALSAGHRPCAECRYIDYRRFRSLWEPRRGDPVSAEIIDMKLHADRVCNSRKRTYRQRLSALPDGTYITLDRAAWLVQGNELFAWSASRYIDRRARLRNSDVDVLTPRSTVAVLEAGYMPGIHPSAMIPIVGKR